MSLRDKKILIGLTGGIACYKTPYVIRELRRQGAEVRVVMTEAATRFITPLTLESVAEQPVAVRLFPEGEYVATRHIDLAEWPDLILVAPATANFMGKVAGGISDDLLTTIICAAPGPVMIAPAMNPRMWANLITQTNYECLKELGYHFIDPAEGDMACDQYGVGRMAEPEQIVLAVRSFVSGTYEKPLLADKTLVITAGPTREQIDPVRYLSNYSSGKMGLALAQSALLLGARVALVTGPIRLLPPTGVRHRLVESTEELHKAVREEFRGADCLIMAAAPVDFAPAPKKTKIKKAETGLSIKLSPTVDILKSIAAGKKTKQRLVGFAFETGTGLDSARQKLTGKKLDLIVLNHPGTDSGFDTDTNRVTIITPHGKPDKWPLLDKHEIAFKLLARVAELL